MIFGVVFGMLIGCSIADFILRPGVRHIADVDLSFNGAFTLSLALFWAGKALDYALEKGSAAVGFEGGVGGWVSFLIYLAVMGAVIGYMVRHPVSGPIGYRKGAAVVSLYKLVIFVFAIIVVAVT
jgi:hypothetical protein